MPRPKTSKEFRAAVLKTFDELTVRLKAEGKKPAGEIADKLGVSRQTAYEYLRGDAVPGPDRLAKLLDTWNLTFEYRGYQVNKGSYSRKRSEPVERVAQQYQLEGLEQRPLKISLPGQDANLRLELDGKQLKVVIDLEKSDK